MATYYKISDEDLADIASAIQEKGIGVNYFNPSEFAQKIGEIAISDEQKTFDDLLEGNLTELNTNATAIRESIFNRYSALTTLNAPMVETLKTSAFYYATGLETVNIPKCTRIDAYAFGGCLLLSRIELPLLESITGSYAFMNCSNLLNISLPKLSYISASGLFYQCSALSEITLPELLKIDNASSMFYYCSNMTQFNAPKLSEIYNATETFWFCTKLTTFNAPNLAIISGRYSMFGYCSSLEKIIFPRLSKLYAWSPFYYCSRLSQVIFAYDGVVDIQQSADQLFANTPLTTNGYIGYYGTIYVPSSYVGSYWNNRYWNYLSSCITSITDDMWAEINAMTIT